MSLLGIDIGTTGCKAASFSADGRQLAFAYREYPTRHPQEGWCELDSGQVWQGVCEVIREVAAATGRDPITALAISSLGEAVVPVTRDRRILGSSILCTDVRGAEYARQLRQFLPDPEWFAINGNVPGAHFSLPKILWLRDHQPQLFAAADHFLLWGPFIAFMLGCEATAFDSLASRTLLLDLTRHDWSDCLLRWSDLPPCRLGRVVAAGTVIGTVAAAVAADLRLPNNVAVVAGGHDQCCAALGSGVIEAGQAVCGIGSFECLTPVFRMPNSMDDIFRIGLNIENHVLPDRYVAFIFNQSGTLIKWFRDTFAVADRPAGSMDIYQTLNQEMPDDPTRLLVLPYFEPTLSPRPLSDASGVIMGLKTNTTRGQILKAIMESVTFYFADSIDALGKLGNDTRQFVATGGGARSDRWLQIKADILGVPFVRPRQTEASVAGAAMLAGLATGIFTGPRQAAAAMVHSDRTFTPDPARHRFYQDRLSLYRELLPATHSLLKRL